MVKYFCWSCHKPAKPTIKHPDSTEVWYLADCCRHAQRKDEEIKALTSTFTQLELIEA